MTPFDDILFMKKALSEAERAFALKEVPVGALLVIDDEVFTGHNSMITNIDPTAHAEIVVIREAAKKINNYRLVGAALYVTLEPCMMCVGAIIQARISRLVYAARDPRYGAVESMLKSFDLDVNHKPEIVSGIMAEQAGAILKRFFKERRNGGVPKWS